MSAGKARLEGLRQDEKFAAIAIERATGAVAHAFDVQGRQSAVDVRLEYHDGRNGALEVTTHAGHGVRQSYGVLARDDWTWPNPGEWWWSAEVGDPRDIPLLRERYAELILLCESEGVTMPHQMSWSWHGNREALRWLVRESTCRLWGHPDVPAQSAEIERGVMITPSGRGGAVDTHLTTLNTEVGNLLTQPVIARHLRKLAEAKADEHHLFIGLGPGAVADGLYLALMQTPATVPTADLVVQEPLSHLWLTTGFGSHLVAWVRGAGWLIRDLEG